MQKSWRVGCKRKRASCQEAESGEAVAITGYRDTLQELAMQMGHEYYHSSSLKESQLAYRKKFDPEMTYAANKAREFAEELIAKLPDQQQYVIRALYFEGKTCKEIAPELGKASKTTISRIHTQALDRMRLFCSKRGVEHLDLLV
jgi:RNA polymerase sigma factor (sigma-70 family)